MEEVFCLGSEQDTRFLKGQVKKDIDCGQVVEYVNQAVLVDQNNRQPCMPLMALPSAMQMVFSLESFKYSGTLATSSRPNESCFFDAVKKTHQMQELTNVINQILTA